MAGNERILAVNPGSMTTKIAVYEGERCVYSTSIEHVRETVEAFPTIADQLEFRKEAIMRALGADGELGERFGAVVGRGGLLKSVPSGTYEVNDEMEEDARTGFHGQHASNLGACLAAGLADELGGTPYVVDPVSVDESLAIAAYSGHKDIPRKPFSHALNIRATAKKAARDIGRPLDTINLVVAHLGSGISVVPMVKGRIIDANNAHSGGPFSPERTGTLPLMEMLDFMERDGLDPAAMKHIITRQGGLMSYLGVNDFREVVGRAKGGIAGRRRSSRRCATRSPRRSERWRRRCRATSRRLS